MSKPLNENLRDVRIETEEGDLIPVMDHAGAKFSELIGAIVSNNKAGTLTYFTEQRSCQLYQREGG